MHLDLAGVAVDVDEDSLVAAEEHEESFEVAEVDEEHEESFEAAEVDEDSLEVDEERLEVDEEHKVHLAED